MKGKILDFSIQSNTGAISGEDGERYNFEGADWKEHSSPARGMSIDFKVDGGDAKEIYLAIENDVSTSETSMGKKNRVTAGVLAICLGHLGIHKFYLGYKWTGVIYLLLFWGGIPLLFIPTIIITAICLIEGISYLIKSDAEFEQTYIIGKKKWF